MHIKTQIAHILIWTLFLVAGAHIAFSWTAPTSGMLPPPTSDTTIVPITTGATPGLIQVKKGTLGFPALLTFKGLKVDSAAVLANTITITGGSPGAGKVLVSDSLGNGRWASLVQGTSTGNCRRSTNPSDYGTLKSWNGRPYYQLGNSTRYFGPSIVTGASGHVDKVLGTISVPQGSCVYTYLKTGSGKINEEYCEALDQRVAYKDIGNGDSHVCSVRKPNGTNSYEGSNNNGAPGCYTLCKEAAYTYIPKTKEACTGLALATNGEYVGTSKTMNDPSLSSSAINACTIMYKRPTEYTCPANTATYTYTLNTTTNKCTRTTISSGATTAVNPTIKSYTAVKKCPTTADHTKTGNWTTYREICI